jgi:hypothetical protein
MGNFFKWLKGHRTWKPEWQDSLADSLKAAQENLSLNVVVVVARESDLYTEILYFVSFLGLAVGTSAAFLVRAYDFPHAPDPLVFPVLGYTVGSLFHVGRRFFLKRWFVRLARAKVHSKAYSYFIEYSEKLQGKLSLLYISETESQAVFVCSPEIEEKLPKDDISKTLLRLEKTYKPNDPLKSLSPALENLSILLKSYAPELDASPRKNFSPPLFVGASDQPVKLVPILKGNKDMN